MHIIRKIRLLNEKTIQEFCNELKVSPKTVWDWEKRKKLPKGFYTYSKLRKLADKVNIKLDEV